MQGVCEENKKWLLVKIFCSEKNDFGRPQNNSDDMDSTDFRYNDHKGNTV